MYPQKHFSRNENCRVNLYQMLKYEAYQFCLNTGLHGYKFIIGKDKSVCARITWACLTTAAFVLGFVLVWRSWQYNIDNKFVIIADSVHNPIWNYRFPSITICNLNKVSLKKAKAFATVINKPNNFTVDHILMLISYFVQLMYLQYDSTNEKYYNELRGLLDVNNLTAKEVMTRIQPECKELLHSCSWKEHIWRCDSLFEEVTSKEGLCCATNYYALKNRVFAGYLPERYKAKPRKTSSCGYKTGYKVLLNNMPEDYLVSALPAYGVKVLIHDAYDYADWSASDEFVPMHMQSFISVVPTQLYTTDVVKRMKISERNCVFTWEKPLKYFANYSYNNCLNECRLDIIKKKCGCTPLYYWSIEEYGNALPCDLKDAACLAANDDLIARDLSGFDNDKAESDDYPLIGNQSSCHCIPDCESTQYSIDTTRSTFSRRKSSNEIEFYECVSSDNHSVINIYFSDLMAMRHVKAVSLDWYAELCKYLMKQNLELQNLMLGSEDY